MDSYQFKADARKWAENVFLVLILIAFVLWSTGCSTMGHERVEGWPDLMPVEHYVSHNEMRDRCRMYVAFGASPEACAEFRFSERRCDIWLSADLPPSKSVIAHERQHCAGWDHIGSTAMRDMLAAYRGK